MINIRTKTEEEIKNEESLYAFGAQIAKGRPKTVCPTYLVKRDGTRVDTYDLTEKEILGLIEIDLVDYTNPRGNYKKDNRTDLDSFHLATELKGHYIPSIDATIKLANLEIQYGHIVRDLMGTIGALNHLSVAEVIARFNKESNGDFEPVTTEEAIVILEQMAVNEINRKQNKSRTK